jgi:hypothetical protein
LDILLFLKGRELKKKRKLFAMVWGALSVPAEAP